MRRATLAAILPILLLSTVYAARIRVSDGGPTPWVLTGKMFSRIFEKDIWVRDRYDRLKLTVAVDSDRCEYSVNLKPFSSVFDVKRNMPTIPKNFDTYDTKLVASFKKGAGLRKRIVRVVKSLLANGLPCDELKYVF